jgi:Right handed beta helix region
MWSLRLVFGLIAATGFYSVPQLRAETIHVNLNATQAADALKGPWRTIQQAVDVARPGDVIELAPGVYLQDVRTVRDGRSGQPITIKGSADAVISGGGAGRVVEVNHSFIELHGFTIDGRHAADERKESFRDKLIYVVGAEPGKTLEGVRVIGMTLRNGGGECVRLRYSTQRSEIANTTIDRCGIYDFVFGDDSGRKPKNGGGIYIGTAVEQIGDWGVPDKAADRSDGNWIHHNTINARSNHCVEIKEGSSRNIVEHNRCTGQLDRHEAGLNSRGNRNVFRYNMVYGNKGAGIRVGGHGVTDGSANEVYENTLRDNEAGGVKVQRMPQGMVCGNVAEDNTGGAAVGDYRRQISPTRSCGAVPVARIRSREAAARNASSEIKPQRRREASTEQGRLR